MDSIYLPRDRNIMEGSREELVKSIWATYEAVNLFWLTDRLWLSGGTVRKAHAY
jgi:hypothetical protein